jgi:superfamily II DNA or RNA helicase
MGNPDEVAGLQAENARLVALLEAHGIEWRVRPTVRAQAEPSRLSTDAKVALFRRLFRGRSDVFPVRWESKSSGRSGYAPACANEWRPGVCEKPRIKCAECSHRQLIPLSDAAIYAHLAGEHTLGVYPLLEDDSCYFLAADFDEADWREDARAFVESCEAFAIPVALEISRSGRGAHAWIFFEGRVAARDARRLGTALISHTCMRRRQLQLASYDRLFPNQDMMPKGGFGNLIALPLQKSPREGGYSVFVDSTFTPYSDQWSFLASIRPTKLADLEPVILQASGGTHPLDVTFIDEEDLATPWKRGSQDAKRLAGPMPSVLRVTRANLLYVQKDLLPQALANRLIRLAAFQNPEFYRAQAMRLSVWDKPRVIGCAENYPKHIALPRGCLEAVQTLLRENGIECNLEDQRYSGQSLEVAFIGRLRAEQEAAVTAMLAHDEGVLCAPTAFGKTVTAAALIARRRVNTLILVHRTELLRQWQARLRAFLRLGDGHLGAIGGGKSRPSGYLDIAVMQSLSRQGEVDALVENYGQVIVDECHHVGAASFESILKRTRAKYVLGLTATPIRRDGQQPIIFLQCGPIRHTASRPSGEIQELTVLPRWRDRPLGLPTGAGIQEVFRELATDRARTEAIAGEANLAFASGHKVLVLTERTEHLEAIAASLESLGVAPWILHGRMTKRQRADLIAGIEALPPDAPRILLATGKLVGEGFDHPSLDTLVLAMPVSWKGTLQQYAGRLHRDHAGKVAVRILDFVDAGHPALMRMWQKRQRGYRAMGYHVHTESRPALESRTNALS